MQRVERRVGDRRGGGVTHRGRVRLSLATERRIAVRRQAAASKLAMFGELVLDGEPMGPWSAVLVVRDGLVIHQRSYLSTPAMLEEMGVIVAPAAVVVRGGTQSSM